MEVAQFIADTCRARLVAWSQHLLDMTIRRENKNNLEVNLWPEILGAAADNVAQSRGDDFAKLSVISFSRVGVAKALRLGQCSLRLQVALGEGALIPGDARITSGVQDRQ